MDRDQALNRAINLAMKWQEKDIWDRTFTAAVRIGEYQQKAEHYQKEFHNGLGNGMLRRELEPLRQIALVNEKRSQEFAQQVSDADREFRELADLLRQHCPILLEFVPSVNFLTDSSADHTPQIRDLKKLEGELRAEQSKLPLPTVMPLTQHLPDPPAEQTYSPAEQTDPPPKSTDLPLGLRWCESPQTILRSGYKKPLHIKNETCWMLFQAMVKAYPNAVAEPVLKRIFEGGPHDRKNAPKRLREDLNGIGLNCRAWQLVEWDGQK